MFSQHFLRFSCLACLIVGSLLPIYGKVGGIGDGTLIILLCGVDNTKRLREGAMNATVGQLSKARQLVGVIGGSDVREDRNGQDSVSRRTRLKY